MRQPHGKIQDGAGSAHVAPDAFVRGLSTRPGSGRMRPALRECVSKSRPAPFKGIEATENLAKSPNSQMVVIGNNKNGLPRILGQ